MQPSTPFDLEPPARRPTRRWSEPEPHYSSSHVFTNGPLRRMRAINQQDDDQRSQIRGPLHVTDNESFSQPRSKRTAAEPDSGIRSVRSSDDQYHHHHERVATVWMDRGRHTPPSWHEEPSPPPPLIFQSHGVSHHQTTRFVLAPETSARLLPRDSQRHGGGSSSSLWTTPTTNLYDYHDRGREPFVVASMEASSIVFSHPPRTRLLGRRARVMSDPYPLPNRLFTSSSRLHVHDGDDHSTPQQQQRPPDFHNKPTSTSRLPPPPSMSTSSCIGSRSSGHIVRCPLPALVVPFVQKPTSAWGTPNQQTNILSRRSTNHNYINNNAAAPRSPPSSPPPSSLASSPPSPPPPSTGFQQQTKRSRYLREMDRRLILDRIANGEKQAALAKEYQVSRSTICNLHKQRDTVWSRPNENPLSRHPKKKKISNKKTKAKEAFE